MFQKLVAGRRTRAIWFLLGLCTGLAVTVAAVAILVVNSFGIRSAGTPDELASQFGITVSWFTDPAGIPCEGVENVAGCYTTRNPDVIYIKAGMAPDVTRYAILHEIGHLTQARLGMAHDECAADRFAQSLGSEYGSYCEPISQ